MMKRILKNLVLASLIATSLVSCDNGSQVKKIAVFAYSDNDPFINSLISGINEKLTENYKVDIFYGINNQTSQNKQIEHALSNDNYSAFIVNLFDRMAASTVVKKTSAKKLPLVFFNREPLLKDIEDSPLTYYVGSDGTSEGIAQGKIVKNLFDNNRDNILNSPYDLNHDGKLNTVLLRGETGHQDTEERSKAVVNELNEFNINYIGIEACDWNRKKGEDAIRKISAEETIELVLSNNDDMALGAVDFYSKNNDITKPIILGVNGTNEGKKAVDKGDLKGTVINDYKYQASVIVDITDDLIKTQKTTYEKMTFSPTTVYMK